MTIRIFIEYLFTNIYQLGEKNTYVAFKLEVYKIYDHLQP